MRQVIRKGIKDIILDEVPDPVPGYQQVVVRPVYSLISSGTETASIHQEGVLKEVADNPSHLRKIWNVLKVNGPMPTAREVYAKFSEYAVLGYSGAGILIDKHPSVTDLELGSAIAYGGEGTGHGESILTGRNLAVRIPDEVPFEHACFATLGSIAMNAVRIAAPAIGDRVAVIGMGLVGQLVAQLARLQGAVVIAVDLRQERVNLAGKLGATHALPGGGSTRDAVMGITNGTGADCVIVAAAAKSSAPCQLALEICRDRGRIVVVGAVEMSFPWEQMYLKEIQLLMARAYGPGSYDPAYEKKGQDYPLPYVRWTENRNMEEVLRLIATGALDVGSLITHRFDLEQAPQAYNTILEKGSTSLAVLLKYPNEGASASQISDSYRRTTRVDIPGPRTTGDAVRFALVGAGNIARWWHMPALQKAPGAKLRAVHSANGARGKSYGLRFKADYCTSNFDDILNDRDIDAVLIASRNNEHARQTIAALGAGKHVFVEKPMALTSDECGQIADAVESSGRLVTVGFNRRFSPYYREMKRHLARRPGPAVVSIRMNSPGISGNYWMADPAIGGAILGEACHFTDLMFWLLDSEPVGVYAYSLPQGRKEPIGENNIGATFQFADGSIGTLTYCTVGSKTSGGERVEVFAPGIGVALEDFKRLTVHGTMRNVSSKIWPDKGYDDQLATFVKAIREGTQPSVTAADGIRSTIACLAMMESARTGQPQRIEFAQQFSTECASS